MAIFKSGGKQKHHIIEVIEYNGSGDVLIWRFPNEDFNTKTQLIVGPSQEAIFVKGGQILGRFTSGTYTLDSKNYPFIRALVGLVTGSVSPFQCSIYYINKMISMGIEWGTDSPIRLRDPIYQVPIDVLSYGDFSVRVENGQKLMEKLVGTTDGFSTENIHDYFSSLMATQIRSVISGIMIQNQISPIGIDAHLADISASACERVAPIMAPYGLIINHFTIANISYSGLEEIEAQIAEETRENIAFQHKTQRHRISTDVQVEDTVKQSKAEAAASIEIGRATAEVNRELGFSAKEQAGMEVAKTLAGNPGPMVGGAGMGFPGMIGGSIIQPSATGTADIVRTIMGNPPSEEPVQMDYAGIMPGTGTTSMGFGMMEEAEQQKESQKDFVDDGFKKRVDKLNYLLQSGAISQDRYNAELERIIGEI